MLTLTDLAISRGGRRLIQGVNLHLRSGELAVLSGPNGSGKTSLLRTIAGLQLPAEGRIEMAEDTAIFAGHQDAIKAQLSVAENLTFWAAIHGQAATQVDKAVSAFNLGDLSTRLAANLSAGQKRRLGLARLIVARRDLWILDEPTVSLDKNSVAMFDAALSAHLAAGGAAIIATHIDLNHKATVVNMQEFTAQNSDADDPFLAGALS